MRYKNLFIFSWRVDTNCVCLLRCWFAVNDDGGNALSFTPLNNFWIRHCRLARYLSEIRNVPPCWLVCCCGSRRRQRDNVWSGRRHHGHREDRRRLVGWNGARRQSRHVSVQLRRRDLNRRHRVATPCPEKNPPPPSSPFCFRNNLFENIITFGSGGVVFGEHGMWSCQFFTCLLYFCTNRWRLWMHQLHIQGGPKKVSHYRESSLNRIKNRQPG